jgi:hypothetical protein
MSRWAMVCVRGPSACHRKSFRARITGQPQPEHLRGAAQPGAQQWSSCRCGRCRWQKKRSCRVCACPPARVSHLVIVACRKPKTRSAAEASSPSESRREHHSDLVRGGFQAIQGGVASGTEGAVAGRASKRLDALGLAMFAISDQSVDVCLSDSKVQALLIGTGEALGGYPLGCSPPAFDLAPGTHRRKGRSHTRRDGAGEATGGAIAWGAWRCRRRWIGVRLAVAAEWAGQ